VLAIRQITAKKIIRLLLNIVPSFIVPLQISRRKLSAMMGQIAIQGIVKGDIVAGYAATVCYMVIDDTKGVGYGIG
jgi:hypothetical protein